jgi:hypothetical protein
MIGCLISFTHDKCDVVDNLGLGELVSEFTPAFMPVNFSNSVESVELEILQDGEKRNEQ